ncbi:MAG TPA: nuclear transport factor 2 family protein [Solirubrobacterales bacterium]
MSQENVEVARQMYEAFNRGDVDAFLERCAPEFEFRDLPQLPGSGVFVGPDGFRAWWNQLTDAFEDLRFDPTDFIDAGDRVVVAIHATGSGRGSAAKVEMQMSNVWTLNDGMVARLTTHADHAEALGAAGLRG